MKFIVQVGAGNFLPLLFPKSCEEPKKILLRRSESDGSGRAEADPKGQQGAGANSATAVQAKRSTGGSPKTRSVKPTKK